MMDQGKSFEASYKLVKNDVVNALNNKNYHLFSRNDNNIDVLDFKAQFDKYEVNY